MKPTMLQSNKDPIRFSKWPSKRIVHTNAAVEFKEIDPALNRYERLWAFFFSVINNGMIHSATYK